MPVHEGSGYTKNSSGREQQEQKLEIALSETTKDASIAALPRREGLLLERLYDRGFRDMMGTPPLLQVSLLGPLSKHA
jgi:hypothetical protein